MYRLQLWTAYAGFVFVAHCGGRTELNVPTREEPDGAAVTVLSNNGPPPGTALCSATLGPVPTCLGTSENGGAFACSSDFPYCIHPPGFETFVCCSGPGPIDGPGGSCPGPSDECPLYRASLPADASDRGASEQCLPDAVLPGSEGLPDCIVVAARLPIGTATASQIDACSRCDAPGLRARTLPLPAWIVSPELEQYSCVCHIDARPQCPVAEAGEVSTASWCYSSKSATSGCGGAALHIEVPSAYEAAVYVACFAAD
jgi:hypothetical protein